MKKYLPAFIIFILVVAGIIGVTSRGLNTDQVKVLWSLYVFFCLITLIFHYGITRATRSRPQVFVQYYMASTTIKLLLNLAIIVVYSVFHKSEAVHFIIAFMILYFLFTIFEVAYVWKTIRK